MPAQCAGSSIVDDDAATPDLCEVGIGCDRKAVFHDGGVNHRMRPVGPAYPRRTTGGDVDGVDMT